MTFGDRMARTMKRYKVKWVELSRKTGISTRTLWKIKTGAVLTPRVETARKIADALDVPIEWLYGDVNDGSN